MGDADKQPTVISRNEVIALCDALEAARAELVTCKQTLAALASIAKSWHDDQHVMRPFETCPHHLCQEANRRALVEGN